MAELAQSLHLASGGYLVQASVAGSNALAHASMYHVVLPVAVPAPERQPRRIDHQSPRVIKVAELDFSAR